MRVGLERGVDQVGNLAGAAVDLDEIRAFYVAQVGPSAACAYARMRAWTVLCSVGPDMPSFYGVAGLNGLTTVTPW
jgi:hypothetical protein